MRPMLLAMLCLVCSDCLAQFQLATDVQYKITGLGDVTRVGNVTLSTTSPVLTSRPVGVVSVTDGEDCEIAVTDVSRLPYQPEKITDGIKTIWLIEDPGKWWVEVREYGELKLADGTTRRIMLDSRTTVIEFSFVPPGPTPDPGPGPQPPPPIPPSPIVDTYGLGKIAYESAPRDATTAARYRSIYKQSGDFLFGIPSLKFVVSSNDVHSKDPNRSVMAWIQQQYSLVQCPDIETCKQWNTWKQKVSDAFIASQKNRQFTRDDWYAAFNEVANALEQIK